MADIRGLNWAVRSNFLGQHQSRQAGVQARTLQETAPSYVTEFIPEGHSWSETDLSVLKVSLEDMPTSDLSTYAGLVGVAQMVNEAAQHLAGGDTSNEIFLNFYQPGGSSGEHRDTHTDATFAVGLLGIADVFIRDGEDGHLQPSIRMYPGDALLLNNEGSAPPEQSPLHRVDCLEDVPRISIVNA